MRTRTLAIPAMVLVLAALSGCGSKSHNGSAGISAVNASAETVLPSGGTTSPITASGAPTSVTATTPTTATPTPTTGGTPKPTKVTYPKNQRAYATAALAAYVAGNQSLLRDFALPATLSNFANLGHPNTHWHFYRCDSDGGNYACLFDNDNGDRLSIGVNPTYFGKPQAVNNVFIDRTQFGTSADSQVGAFLQAWFDGNVQRMEILSTGDTASRVRNMTTPTSWMLSDDTTTTPGVTLVKARLNNDSLTLDVNNSKLGKAHAISSAPAG